MFDDGSRGRGAHAPAPRAKPGAPGSRPAQQLAVAAAGSPAQFQQAPVAAGPAPGIVYADLVTRIIGVSSMA